MTIIADYLKDLTAEQQAALRSICDIVTELAPDAAEVVSYGMPGYHYKDKYLVTFGAFRDHLSIFPGSAAIAALQEAGRLDDFTTSKGTVQFTAQRPLPKSVVSALIKHRLSEINKEAD